MSKRERFQDNQALRLVEFLQYCGMAYPVYFWLHKIIGEGLSIAECKKDPAFGKE